jgi:multidrug efflux pump subunit AcrB
VPPGEAIVAVEAPVGAGPLVASQSPERVGAELPAINGFDDAESVVAAVGGSGGGSMVMGGGPSGPEAGRVTVSFVDFQDRSRSSFETLANMQRRLGEGIAGAEISVDQPQEGPPSGPPVNVEIVGEDPDVLKRLSERAIEIVENAPVASKLVRLQSDMETARPELSVQVDREKAAMYGLSTSAVGSAVRSAIQGVEAAKFRTRAEEYDIVVRLAEPYRRDISSLEDLTAMTEDGVQVPLVSVADWEVREGFGSIKRKDLDRVATVSSEVRAGYNSNAVLAEVQAALSDFRSELPAGYQVRYTGQSEDQAEAQSFLSMAFLAALMLMVFILISQFNSVVKPVIILTSVLLSTGGVLLGLMIFRMPFVMIMTGVGIISLAGIVVNNAIVLIDYIDILRERDGLPLREAIVEGGKVRFRPVVLTAVTTALGLVPLAIGLNFDFFGLFGSLQPELYWGGEQAAWWGPMAVAVIVGIIFATVLTLILVPVMLSLVEQLARWSRRTFLTGAAAREDVATAPAVSGAAEPEPPAPAPPRSPDRPEREPAEVYASEARERDGDRSWWLRLLPGSG